MTNHNGTLSSTDPQTGFLLDELQSLNYRFVELVCTSADTATILGLPPELQLRLCSTTEDERRRLAGCPYSLFDLDLANDTRWRNPIDHSCVEPDPVNHAVQLFSMAALMFVKRLAVESSDLGKPLLGMRLQVAKVFRELSVGNLMDRASSDVGLLTVRLVKDPRFWPDLINFVHDGTPQQYLAAQTSALQLMAAGDSRR